MDADFWLERWRDGQTRFHQDRVTPLLQKYWPSLSLEAGSRVLVPLCGKSLDLVWLARQGHQVLGVELSPLAVDQFFAENGLRPEARDSALGRHHVAGNIEIICGDIFALDQATLAACAGVYDRAALVALPAGMRERYVRHVYGQLSDQYRGLLLTLDYRQEQMDGPPFSVREAEVLSLYGTHSDAQVIDRRSILDKEPKFAERGLTGLDTVVYRLGRKAAASTA
ncbi:thiopurine S-methyltransferase [Pollutimonas bauzanensis]|uniref:Thiopurine S-methyltransferase n=1 Tax=Pollutimonas bauzanensis TaxID=658167 RepID=A0A1M5ZXH0_9BURK|nr:thiopurine S-methyltransferase [Pollutimonas bauzanensis]SHI28964.1 thiopurine S-methyltransferase [Pollutimonas bauzanensis]